MHGPGLGRRLAGLLLAALAVLLAACDNSPYPPGAAAANTIYTAFTERSPRHLDPVASYWNQDTPYTSGIYEPLYGYHYLKRPYTLVPRLAQAVAEPVYLDKSGRPLPADAPAERVAESVYEIRIRPGVRYQPHPAFARDAQGRWLYHTDHALDAEQVRRLAGPQRSPMAFPVLGTREVVAEDFVHAFKRHATPRVPAPLYALFAQHVVGLKAYGETVRAADTALRAGLPPEARDLPFLDFRRWPLAGVTAPEKHRLRIRLLGKVPQWSYWLATTFAAPVPWEAEAFYAQPGMAELGLSLDRWPVGSGAFMMTVAEQDRRHVLERNPNYRGEPYPCEGMPGDAQRGLLDDCGRPTPFVDRVELRIEREQAPLKLKFRQGYLDLPEPERSDRGADYRLDMQDSDAARLEYTTRGLQLPVAEDLTIWYLGFNMLDPVVGQGDTPERAARNRALRQAVAIVLDWGEYGRVFPAKGGVEAMGPLPAGVAGSRLGTREGVNPVTHRWVEDPAAPAGGRAVRRSLDEARALLAQAGYPGGRDAASGRPLTLYYDFYRAPTPELRSELDWLQRRFALLGIELQIRATDNNQFQDKVRRGRHQLFFSGWGADYPDAENFLFLLYGPNAKSRGEGENTANYADPEYDRLFRRLMDLEPGPQRQALIDRMVAIVQRDTPWAWGYVPQASAVFQPWVHNAVVPVLNKDLLRHLRIDTAQRARLQREWNAPPLSPWALGAGALGLVAVGRLWRARRRRRRHGLEG